MRALDARAVGRIRGFLRRHGPRRLQEQPRMNKAQLIDHIAEQADLTRQQAARALDAFTSAVTTTLAQGGDVTLVGFGTFVVDERAARKGRNPKTGETVEIAAAKMPKFRPGKALKDAVNG
jgi:DNA-binding protein HU-beta